MGTSRYRQQRHFTLTLLPLVALSLMAAIAGPAKSQAPPPPGHSPIDEQVLQLNPDQKSRFTDFENKSRAEKKKLTDQLRDLRHQLWTSYQSYNLDVGKCKDLNRQINKVQHDLLKLHFDEQVELRKILTEDQFNRLQAAIRQQIEAAQSHWRDDHHDDHHGAPDWPPH